MGKIYRITLIEEDGDEYGTLFELAGSPAMLTAAAPGAIAAALSEVGIAVSDRVIAGAAPAEGNFGAGQPKPRTRRTKAQMAADAAAAEAQPEQHVEPVATQPEQAAGWQGETPPAAPYNPFGAPGA